MTIVDINMFTFGKDQLGLRDCVNRTSFDLTSFHQHSSRGFSLLLFLNRIDNFVTFFYDHLTIA